MENKLNKYDSILAAVEFADPMIEVQKALDDSQLLKDKKYSLGLSEASIKKINPQNPSEVLVSLNRIQLQESEFLVEKSNEIINIIQSLNEARSAVVNNSVNKIKFCGAIFTIKHLIDDKEIGTIEKIFNLKNVNKETRSFNFKSDDSKYNYNIVTEFDYKVKKHLKIIFDVNNIHQTEEKKIEQLEDIINEIKNKIDKKKNFFNFIETLL